MRLMNRFARPALAAACLVCALATCVCAGSRWSLVTILHTNDLHGSVAPRDGAGGLARVATLVREIRAEMPNVLLIEGGDIIHGTPEDYLSGHVATVCAMNVMGYDAAATGNHEYDFGLPTLERVTNTARFPFLAANVRAASGGDWNGVRRYVVLSAGGVRIGVLGLTTLDTISLHWPGSIKDITVQDPIKTAESLVPKVAAESDVVLVLSHLGADQDRVLAKNVPGIDFIVGGHSHTSIADWEWSGGTLIAQTGAYAQALGRIDFIARTRENGAEIWSVNGRRRKWNDLPRRPLGLTYPDAPLLPVGSDVALDPAVRAAYEPFRQAADARLCEVIGSCPSGVAGRVLAADESPAADLLADAVRGFARSDVAVIDSNGLGDRGIAAGPVTVGAVYDLIGGYTRQHIVVGHIAGRDLLTALNAGFARKKAINAAVSGASVEYQLLDGVPRATNLTIGGAPIDPAKQYSLAAQAYVMMSIMEAVPGAVTITAELAQSTREALVDYVRACRTLAPPDLGRIKGTE